MKTQIEQYTVTVIDGELNVSCDGVNIQVNINPEGLRLNVLVDDNATPLQTITMDNATLFPTRAYRAAVERFIDKIAVKQTISEKVLKEAHMNKYSALEAVEAHFNEVSFDVEVLTPLQVANTGRKMSFSEWTDQFERPFIAISDEEYQKLIASGSSFFKTPAGTVFTAGRATTFNGSKKYALMPLKPDSAKTVLALREKSH